jgi:type I restriction enzyme S subunit
MIRKYDKYKDSGVEWIGEIPEGWEVKKLKYLTKLQGGYAFKSDVFTDIGIPVIRIGDIKTPMEYDKCKCINGIETIGDEFLLKDNDTLIALSGATTGKMCFLSSALQKAFINQRVAKVNYNNKLVYYLLSSDFVQRQILLTADGSAQENISNSQIENIIISIPPLTEQTAIASFLDRKTTEIDQLVTRKEKLIALYAEEKTAIINHTVTKGLDPQVNTKPSGVEWLGDIPENWEVKRLKYVAKVNPTKDSCLNRNSEELVVFLPMEKVQETGNIDCELKKPVAELWNGFTFFRRNDVILAKITPCFENGKGALLNTLETEVGFGSTEYHVLRSGESITSVFLYFVTKSELFMKIGEAFMTGSAGQKRVPTDFVSEFNIALPPITEQSAIVAYIETECSRLDTIIEKFKNQIDLLKEYRTTLISEVVTGKIDVRDEEMA